METVPLKNMLNENMYNAYLFTKQSLKYFGILLTHAKFYLANFGPLDIFNMLKKC